MGIEKRSSSLGQWREESVFFHPPGKVFTKTPPSSKEEYELWKIGRESTIALKYLGGKNIRHIKKEAGVTDETIVGILLGWGIDVRTRKQALKLSWSGEDKRAARIAKTQSPEAKKKRRKSMEAQRKTPAGKEAFKIFFEAKLKADKRKRRKTINSIKSVLGSKSDKELRVKLEELNKTLSLKRARLGINEIIEKKKGIIIGATAYRGVMAELGIRIDKKNTKKRGAKLNEVHQKLVLEARKSGFFDKLESSKKRLLDLRHSVEGEPLTHAKIGEKIGVKRTTVVERTNAAYRDLEKLSFLNSPVDSKAA